MATDISLRMLLHDIGLPQYETIFRERGYDSAQLLLNMARQDLEQLRVDTQILPGHWLRLQQEITHRQVRWAQRCNSPVSAQMTTFLRDPARNVLREPGPTLNVDVAVPTAESEPPVQATTVPLIGSHSDEEKKIRESLFSLHPKWDTAKLVSLQFSTVLGRHSMQDNKKRGRFNRVFRCSSVLSKKRRQDGEDPTHTECPHLLHWTCKKKDGRNWRLDRDKSYIDHAPWCSSEQKVSKLELEHDPDFVKHVKLEKKATGGSCAKSALGRMGRVDGSVKVHTARRAQNCTKRCNLADYTHDFNKIKGWIRDYMEQNRESRAEVKVDHENRSVVRPQPFGLPGP